MGGSLVPQEPASYPTFEINTTIEIKYVIQGYTYDRD